MTVGVDLVHVPGFAQQLEDTASGFVDHTFTPRERRSREPHRLAARFAAKEAFLKAWSGSRAHQPPLLGSVDLREIEVVDDGYGRPALALHGTLAQTVGPCSTSLSLSHDGDAAIAVVLFQSGT
ncbi:holo-ACP synthase [Solirubrobacter sp. CPCC 204708]|uniref:Holo-[acyl-carrier-protein] synthase n=1 Tax=Solirubrobacter deserti TaxID=2282478 RepID=A0ABT4RDG4_9ACTN|nr:holo-ACP synthase [Solirubrobacter deserti]MBE2314565.1 holo-ACP synthase [Solirubrobacter deserti]MDA0136569.1 holo-ACP synthase [Solirubrobacter deserti]